MVTTTTQCWLYKYGFRDTLHQLQSGCYYAQIEGKKAFNCNLAKLGSEPKQSPNNNVVIKGVALPKSLFDFVRAQ